MLLYAQFYFLVAFLNGIDFLCFLLVLLLLCVFFLKFCCLETMTRFFKTLTIFSNLHCTEILFSINNLHSTLVF